VDRRPRPAHPAHEGDHRLEGARDKAGLTEYNWGNDGGITSALAQVEALHLAREGVDYANRWIAPAVGSRVEDAFRLYSTTMASALAS